MKLQDKSGKQIYYNPVIKHGKQRYLITAIDGQYIQGRDRQKRKTRTFAQEHQALAWLERNGYTEAN